MGLWAPGELMRLWKAGDVLCIMLKVRLRLFVSSLLCLSLFCPALACPQLLSFVCHNCYQQTAII